MQINSEVTTARPVESSTTTVNITAMSAAVISQTVDDTIRDLQATALTGKNRVEVYGFDTNYVTIGAVVYVIITIFYGEQ